MRVNEYSLEKKRERRERESKRRYFVCYVISVSYTHLDVYKRQVGSGQRAALWQGIERYQGVFADVPGRAKNYELSLIHI